jgi:acyl transferase domain-containing protein
VDVVEAHGTGTTLGDPIEAQALLATYGVGRPIRRPLLLGSVKSNIGHTQAAAGVAGVIKMVLAMERGEVPATLHVDTPSSHVDWSAGGVSLVTEQVAWPVAGRPRRAGVSAFGISGTNAHVILEQAPPVTTPAVEAPGVTGPGASVPWVLSARTRSALREQAARLLAHVQDRPELTVSDVAFSLAARSTFEHRAVVVGADRAALVAGLGALAEGTPSDRVLEGSATAPPKVAFVFPGQGAQWVGMARDLLASSPVFAASMAECAAALSDLVDWSLFDVLDDEDALTRVDVVQPVLWAVMVGLAELWASFGVRPSAVLGHSQGEIAAACVAGAVTVRDAARLVVLRSRALATLAGTGGMASIPLPLEESTGHAKRHGLTVAAVNGPSSVVVSGPADGVTALVEELVTTGVRARRIPVDYASHSDRVESVRDDILAALGPVVPTAGRIPFFSTVSASWFDTAGLDAGYWYRNLRETVRFQEAV